MMEENLDVLPQYILEKLKSLQLELEDGDITQKGYDKKRQQILSPYAELMNRPPQTEDSQSLANDDETESYQQNQDEIERERQLVEQELGPEPSAADVDDFLDFLPSPTHTPAMDYMEANHNQLAKSEPLQHSQAILASDRDLRPSQSMNNMSSSASINDIKKSLSSDGVPSDQQQQTYSRPLPVPPLGSGNAAVARGRPPPELSINIPGRAPTFGRPPPPHNASMMGRPPPPSNPSNQFATFPPNIRPPNYRPGQPNPPFAARPPGMYANIPGQPMPLRPMGSINHRPMPPPQGPGFNNYAQPVPQPPTMRPRNWMPPSDPNGVRKRRSIDLVQDRMEGAGLSKSSTIRTVDPNGQRGDWGNYAKTVFT